MARVKIEDATKAVEVELWKNVYRIRPVTRSVQQQLSELDEEQRLEDAELAEGEDPTPDTQIERVGKQWDILLEPVGDAPPPSEVLTEKWEADEVSMATIGEFDGKLARQMLPPSLARSLPR